MSYFAFSFLKMQLYLCARKKEWFESTTQRKLANKTTVAFEDCCQKNWIIFNSFSANKKFKMSLTINLNKNWLINLKTFLLAYTQVATLAVYSYLFSAVFAKQFLEPRGASLDSQTFKYINVTSSEKTSFYSHTPVVYVPIFSILVNRFETQVIIIY